MASKVDLSLDDIIALNRREAGSQRGRGRGSMGRGRGRGRRTSGQQQQQQTGGGAEGKPGGLTQRRWRTKGKTAQSEKDTVANIRTRSQQKAQQLRQKARQTLFNKRRNQIQQQQQQTRTPQQRQKQQLQMDMQQQTPNDGSTGVKQRLGIASMRGRGHGVGIRGRGRGRGSSQVQSTVGGGATASRPGSQLKNIRNTKALTRGRGRGGRGRSPGGSLARQALSQLAEQQSPSTKTPQRGRGRGRGRGLRRPGSASSAPTTPSGATNIQLTVVQDPEEFEPIGVELPHDFAIQHHTTKSLNTRFTPKTEQKTTQRFIHQGDRAVNFQS